MTHETVQPALTREEWGRCERAFEYWGRMKLHSDGRLEVRDTVNHPSLLYNDEKHALAALALHQQPFGFTREDVEDLEDAIQGILSTCLNKCVVSTCSCGGLVDRIGSLAARIAALLPPEDA